MSEKKVGTSNNAPPQSLDQTFVPGQDQEKAKSTANNDLDAELTDAVLVVVNSGSGAIRADDYMAYASQGGLLMSDAAAATAALPAARADTAFNAPDEAVFCPTGRS